MKNGMKHQTIITVWALSLVAGGGWIHDAAASSRWSPPGRNLALNRPYQVQCTGKTTDYYLTKDEGDAVQLTDGHGAPATNAMWFFKETVAWNRGPVSVTIDLGETRAIGGMSYRTENGPHAGVNWPPAILILVSEDGQEYRLAGELVTLSARFGPPPATGRHAFVTDELKTRGRYVRLIIQGSILVVSDEIEIYEGRRADLKNPASGPVIEKPIDYFIAHRMPYAVAARVATDAARAGAVIDDLGVSRSVRKRSRARLEDLQRAAQTVERKDYDRDFHAVAPLNEPHEQVFAVLGGAYRAAGYPEFMIWTTNRWARQTPFDRPPRPAADPAAAPLQVRMMRNERRGEVVNIGHFGEATRSATVRFSGLPGGSCPDYLEVRQAEYLAMPSRPWDADPLPRAEKTGDGWRVTLPPGMSRQLWLDFRLDAHACPAGRHQGEALIQVDDGPTLTVPLELTVAPFDMPEKRAVAVGVWDYSDQGGWGGLMGHHKGVNDNLAAAVAHMQESGITAPWSRAGSGSVIFPRPHDAMFDAEGKLVNPPDFTAFDEWVKRWPDATYYMIYANGWGSFGEVPDEEKVNQPELDETQRRFGEVMKVWAEHIRGLGIDPARIVICLFDEPQFSSQSRIILYWARAIKAAVPEFKLYEDTRFKTAYFENPYVLRMLDLVDIITPGTDYDYQRLGQPAVDFYEKLRQKGKIMGFYVCAQTPSEAEATRYYRLQQWACWMINAGGRQSWSGFWSYSDVRGGTPWNQLAGGNDKNWCPAYLDYTSATDGKHWLAIFEGVQDYEYLLMLKDRIAAARQAGRDDETIAAAQTLLDELPSEVITAVRAGDQTACDKGRLRVLAALETL